jgi:hypothetical protein
MDLKKFVADRTLRLDCVLMVQSAWTGDSNLCKIQEGTNNLVIVLPR